MTRVLDVLEDYLDWRGLEHLRLDGAVSSAERGSLVKQFNAPGRLSTDCCGVVSFAIQHCLRVSLA